MKTQKRKFDPSETLYRQFTIGRAVDGQDRTRELSWCSEEPVDRYFGVEILDCKPGSVRLNRLKSGAANLLWNHNPDKVLGVIENASIGSDKRGHALARFGKGEDAEEKFQDVSDGIITSVSVGYRVHSMVLEKSEEGVETFRVTDWEPFEISLVSVPADASVGVGRSQEITGQRSNNMSEQNATTAAPAAAPNNSAPAVTVNESQIRTAEITRIREIDAICQRFNVPAERREKAISSGETIDAFRTWLLTDHLKAEPVRSSPEIGMSNKEKKRYSLVGALRSLASNQPLSGLEREASEATAKVLRRAPEGFFIPHDITSNDDVEMKRALMAVSGYRSLLATQATAGGYTVQTDLLGGSMIELLRNNMLLTQLGVRQLGGLIGNIAIPKQTGGSTAYWLAEGEAVTVSQMTFGQVGLTPKKLCSQTGFSKQLLAQSSIEIEASARFDLMANLAVEKDRAGIYGTGGKQPLGIFNTPDIETVTFGAAPTWAKVVEFETKMASANAQFGSINWLVTPPVRGKWKTTVKATNTATYLCENNEANGYSLYATNQVPSTKAMLGNFAQAMFADWAGMDVVVDPYTQAGSGLVIVTITLLTDFGVRQPKAFVVSTDSAMQ